MARLEEIVVMDKMKIVKLLVKIEKLFLRIILGALFKEVKLINIDNKKKGEIVVF